jgi:GNAT superfamily N-acetyltransferase
MTADDPAPDVSVRPARPGDLSALLGVLDAAALETDHDRARASVERGQALVAVAGSGTVVGALVREDSEITAVAVRRGRRGQGIGTALVDRAGERARREERDALVAEFDRSVRPFYEKRGFDVEPTAGENRYRGSRPL